MPYTLVKWLLWLLLAGLVGVVVGWLLRGVRCRSEVATARASTVDADEVLAMRRRLANLELTVEERNRFKAERDELRQVMKQRLAGSSGAAGIAGIAGLDDVAGGPDATQAPAAPVAPPLDDAALARGAEVLGQAVRLDDLTLIEGIGPKIAELLQSAGITTWWGLATGGVEPVKATLAAAGPRYQVHDPSTWPRQADLLAHGRWEEFRALTDQLDGGREG
jgi:predicted flap endonuclease-1-like 5' DNA nuclease